MFYYKVAVKRAFFKLLTYSSEQNLSIGQRVQVPLGKNDQSVSGVVLDSDPEGHKIQKLKNILQVDKSFPLLDKKRLKWLQWMSHYYHYPIGLTMALGFPPLPFKKEKAVTNPFHSSDLSNSQTSSIRFTPEQTQCMESVSKTSGFHVHLLCGVTGSGKTEVYKMVAEKILKQGKQVLVLLPEIFLTPQILIRFSKKFPNQTAVLHSKITPRKKTTVWQELFFQEKNLLIGTRSALFCSLPRLGLIVVDEEHEGSFKQDDQCRYHARDSAIMLARILNIPIILGSATPSLSSLYQAKKGRYQFHRLTNRPFAQALPTVNIVDLKKPISEERPFWLSDTLYLKMKQTLKKGKQVALFLNRRGKATALICLGCGHVQKCRNCDISLTVHGEEHLLCHYCSYMEKKPSYCSFCKQNKWLERGLGTEKVEQTINQLFPEATVVRADRDTIDSREEMEAFIQTVEQKKAQIIIGTQMIAKGLDFPSIHMVGLLLADMGFHFPDFRASERTLQILLQMAGRAGRKEGGEVVLQTFHPEHLCITFAESHDYLGFCEEEMKSRKKLSYPPFSRLCLIQINSSKEQEGAQFATKLEKQARKKAFAGIKILGPSPAPLFRINNRYRFHLLIKGTEHFQLQKFLNGFLNQIEKKPFVKVTVDRDPVSML